ncbi:MAG: DUF6356 family protein [Gammaproteobacteria bacterium]|nr:DUF6356 family protein [Gammaproteobacteria bacterium]
MIDTLKSMFTDHPESVGEGYLEHFGVAMMFSLTMISAGILCFVHALLPFLFTETGSKTIEKLHANMIIKRTKKRDH